MTIIFFPNSMSFAEIIQWLGERGYFTDSWFLNSALANSSWEIALAE